MGGNETVPNASAERMGRRRCTTAVAVKMLLESSGCGMQPAGRGKSGAFGVERNGTLALKWPAPYHDAGYYRGWSMRRSEEEIIAAASQMIR